MESAAEGRNWAVIGGGLLGMTLALRLAQHGHSVTLIEQAETLGGLATAWRLGDVVWDRHYHVTLMSDSYTRALLDELGLEKEMNAWLRSSSPPPVIIHMQLTGWASSGESGEYMVVCLVVYE